MGYRSDDYDSSTNTKWGLFFLVMLLTGFIFLLLAFSLRERFDVSDAVGVDRTIEGTLDYNTAQYLIQQDEFIMDFYNILEADFPTQDLAQESTQDLAQDLAQNSTQNSTQEDAEGQWMESFNQMQIRIDFMKSADVSAPFLSYKKEVNLCYSDVFSILKNMVDTGNFDGVRLSNMYEGLLYFSNQQTDALPPLFDELDVEYTIEEDENGQISIQYEYTTSGQ